MSVQGKHRRSRNGTGALVRRLAVVGAGGAALAIPVVGATGAQAAPQGAAHEAPVSALPADASATSPEAQLDGWINDSLAIMAQQGIPGSYDGIYRNIMRESSGDPNAVNNYDSNAQAGTPSKGLLQVIDPTFETYHVPGTSWDSLDPVANITAACNYAAATYGSIDNVNGPY